MKKRILATVLTGAMLLAMSACGSAQQTDSATESAAEQTTAAATDEDLTISVILKTTASEHWQYIIAGCRQYEAENPNVTVDVKGPASETSYDEQQNMIETDQANATYDAYVIAPLQADMVSTMIAGQTKPVLALDTNIDAPEILSFIGTGNENAAKMGAVDAVKAAKEAGWEEINCIEIAGVQGDATNNARMAGYQAGIEESGGTFLVDEIQYANAVADQAVTCMEAIMQTHPEGVAIICANNDDMAVAAARTAEGNPAYENTIFLGFDGQQSACEAILEGQLTMTVAQEAYKMGYMAVDAAVKAIGGEKLEEHIDSGSVVIDASNAEDRINTLQGYLGE